MTTANERFIPPDFTNHSPLTWYQAAASRPGFIQDASQRKAIECLDKLWTELMMFKRKRNRFLGRSLRSPQLPKGLYFYGGVGRGKSFLMDVFYGCLPYRRKRRVHFHAFMAEIHRRLRELKSEQDPLKSVAAEIARETRVLCFDEFHVSDIADAMTLGFPSEKLEALFQKVAGADAVVAAAPVAQVFSDALRCAAKGGRINFFAGLPSGAGTVPLDANLIHYNELLVTGTTANTNEDCQEALELVASVPELFAPLITHRVPLRQADKAFALAASGGALKVVLEP